MMNEQLIGFRSISEVQQYIRDIDNRLFLKGFQWLSEPDKLRAGNFLFIIEDLPYEDGYQMEFLSEEVQGQNRIYAINIKEFEDIKIWLEELQQQESLEE